MIQKQLRDNAEQTYNNSIKYYNELIENVEEFKEKNVSLLPTYDEEQLTKYQEELNAMVAAAEEAGDQVMSDYENLLETAQELLELELEQKNKKEMLEMVQNISNMVNIHYIRQKEPKGLGHAVHCAKSFIGDEPFAVLLGDDIVDAETPSFSANSL